MTSSKQKYVQSDRTFTLYLATVSPTYCNKKHFFHKLFVSSCRMPPLSPGGRVDQPVTFIPNMVGVKMLQASLLLTNVNVTIRGFKMVSVNND